MDFDPASVIEHVACPMRAGFGGADLSSDYAAALQEFFTGRPGGRSSVRG